jgi:DNA repair exonuclease SbcCD nuclease subunit
MTLKQITDEKLTFKKSACFTDIHFGKKNNSDQHNADCLNYIDWFCEKVRQENDVDHIVFLGDWFEHRNAINVQTLNKAWDAMTKLDALGLPIYFIIGNHDLYLRNQRHPNSLVFASNFKNFYVIDELTLVNKHYLFSPFLFPEEYVLSFGRINLSKVVYGHFEFKGFVITGDSVKMEHGYDHREYAHPVRIFSGHFHKRQIQDNIVYIGNTFPMDFSDANDLDRGLMFYRYETDEMVFHSWESAPSYISTTLSDLLDDAKSILRPRATVRCLADIDVTLEESTKLKEKFINKFELRSLSLEEPVTDEIITDTNMDLTGLELEDTDTIVRNLLSRIHESKIKPEILIQLYNSLTS